MQQPQTLIEGKYEIIAKIREGGMGTIYKVRHRLLDEVRVIKVMKPQVVADPDLKRRFVEEAKTATRLKHPNICTIHDFALDEDGTAYLVMEFIDGVNLAELMHSRGSPELRLTLEIAHQTLLALGYLHRRNVVHRDIAPDNLMMTHDDEGRPRIKLIDLGIAKALDKRGGEMTSTGVFLGKLKYASPEQYGALPPGEKIDGRSDLYCLGVVLYELLTGTRPFFGESPAELLRAHLFAPPVPFEESDPRGAVPADLRAVVLKALEKNREDRFATAEAFDREIVTLMGRFGDASELPQTVQLLSNIRSEPIAADRAATITPSAQDRLDRQFGPHTTPHPSRSELLSLPRTVATALPRDAAAESAATAPQRPAAPRARLPALALVALAAAAVLAVILWPRRSGSPARERPAAALPTAAPAALPTVPAQSAEPTRAQAPPPAAVLPEAAKEGQPEATAPPAAPTADDRRPRREVESARGRALSARSAADRARAAEHASALYEFGRRKQMEGQQLLARKDYAAAQSAFDSAGSAFAQAETWSRAHPPSTPERIAAAPTPRPEPPVRAAPPPTALPASVEPSPRPAPTKAPESARPAPAEQDRIREVLHDYERAHNTLDVDLYARVFPSFVAQQRQSLDRAWQGLRSQRLELEIRQIDVKGAQASVRALQRLVVMPQAGIEQRDAREVVLQLEKRGESWVITGRN